MRAFVLAGCLALGWLAACVMSTRCPCGEDFTSDPFDPDAGPVYVEGHALEDHCFCRCGDGPAERLPPSATCDGYEGPCRAPDGSTAAYRCE